MIARLRSRATSSSTSTTSCGALEYAVENDLPGIYNVAPRRRAGAVGGDRPARQARAAGPAAARRPGAAAALLRRLGFRLPPEMLRQLRYGRGLDNRKLKAAGFRYELHDARDGAEVRASTCACGRC